MYVLLNDCIANTYRVGIFYTTTVGCILYGWVADRLQGENLLPHLRPWKCAALRTHRARLFPLHRACTCALLSTRWERLRSL